MPALPLVPRQRLARLVRTFGLPSVSCAALCIAAAHTAPAATPPVAKPDIIYILADDLGYADTGFNGAKDYPTPHLDALAASGTVLTQHYALPLCTPTRAALLTGRYPIRYGLQVSTIPPWMDAGLDPAERTLAQALRETGYTTAMIGKWHLGKSRPAYRPNQRGFDHAYGHYEGAIDYFTHERDGKPDWFRNGSPVKEEGYATHLTSAEADRLIRAQPADKPLFLYAAYTAVHDPHQAAEADLARFSHLPEPRRTYAAMIAALDDGVGQIVRALEETGRRDRALIVFSSDNGGVRRPDMASNRPWRDGKDTLHEGGTRVCAFVNWPGRIPAGRRSDVLMHVTDWYPTLLNLAGASLKQPRPLDGLDQRAALFQDAPSARTELLYNSTPAHGALRVGDWKLIVGGAFRKPGSPAQPTRELYNLALDPAEKNNLAQKEPQKFAELLARYRAYATQAVKPLGVEAAGGSKPGQKLNHAPLLDLDRLAD